MATDIQNVDFLPAEYRQQNARRKQQSWRLSALGILVAGVALVAFGQNYFRSRIARELTAIAPRHELALAQTKQLADLESQLKTARAQAELYTYLRHPWPRTQILAAVLEPLPEELTFQRIEILQRRRATEKPTEARSRSEQKAEEARLAALPLAARTLKQLRDDAGSTETVVTISGVTADSAALHRYMETLEKCRLFSKVELSDFESAPGGSHDGTLRFRASLVVRPGYGQPGGPTIVASQRAAQPRKNS